MAKFYEMQRKRLNILVDADGAPHGGQWSFDADNRKKLPKGITVPLEPASPQQIDVASILKQLKHEQLPLL